MEKDILSFAVEKTHELIGAPTCSSETKAAAEAWLNAVGTEQEAEETKKYIDELEADIMPIDNLSALRVRRPELRFLELIPLPILQFMQRKSKLPERSSVTARPVRLLRQFLRKKKTYLNKESIRL